MTKSFREAREEITGESWADDLARESLLAAEAQFSGPAEHGTIAGYRRHRQAGEDACKACAERYDQAYAVQYGRARRRAHKRLKDEYPERFAALLAEERTAGQWGGAADRP